MIKLWKDNRGSAVIVELAVLLPLMIMIFYGFTIFTNALATDLALKTAAREGAREYAITHNVSDGIKRANDELDSSKIKDATVVSFKEGDGRGIKVSKKIGVNVPFAGFYGPELIGVGLFVEEPTL